jgi:hypothetical protein
VGALPDSPRVDEAAVAAAVEGLRKRGASCQAYLDRGVCVSAVNAGERRWPAYAEAVSRRAAVRGRRLLPVIGSGAVDGRCWIAYDMGAAISLPEYGGVLATATCQRVLSDVARALDEAAGDGVYAWELPPGSVFVSERGSRLGDLGTAREALRGAWFKPEGDTAHVPPEVLRGERAGERSGVYLFGALLRVLLTGASPWRALPASIDAVVASAMADDPERRPRTAGETQEMAARALRGEPARRSRRQRRRAAAKQAEPANPAAAKPAPSPRPAAPTPAAAKPAPDPRPPAAKPAAPRPRRAVPKPRSPRRAGRLRALAVGGAVVLGAASGVLLGWSMDPDPPAARTVDAGAVTISVRAEPGSGLRVRAVDRRLPTRPGAEPVRLGAIEAWRRSKAGAVTYQVPTTRGTLVLICGPGSPDRLRRCERAASTTRLRDAKALPVAGAIRDRKRLLGSISALAAEREDARARLGRAETPEGQRVAARDLADSYARTARALGPVTAAEPVATAARAAADAYMALAESASTGSAGGWDDAGDRVRRSEAALAEAVARVS